MVRKIVFEKKKSYDLGTNDIKKRIHERWIQRRDDMS